MFLFTLATIYESLHQRGMISSRSLDLIFQAQFSNCKIKMHYLSCFAFKLDCKGRNTLHNKMERSEVNGAECQGPNTPIPGHPPTRVKICFSLFSPK